MKIKQNINTLLLSLSLCLCSANVIGHNTTQSLSTQLTKWLSSVKDLKPAAHFPYSHAERTAFQWIPTSRAGVPLKVLKNKQRHELRDILRHVLSEQGAKKLDAIIATEAGPVNTHFFAPATSHFFAIKAP